MAFIVEGPDGTHWMGGGEPKFVKQTAGTVQWQVQNTAGPLAVECRATMEFDGHMGFTLKCEAAKTVELRDVRLEMYVRREAAGYFMGFGRKGGLLPKEPFIRWKWGGEPYFDSFWLGDVPAGLQCELRGASYCGPLVNPYWHANQLQLPESWANGGRGGCEMGHNDNLVWIHAYCGQRTIEAGRPITFEFALLPTPVKPLDTATHFRERYYHNHAGVEAAAQAGGNIINIHHANKYNPFINYPFLANNRLRTLVKAAHARDMKLKIYYTMRELTNHTVELWALRSLGHEVLAPGGGSGYPWLREHLIDNYGVAWYDHLRNFDPLAQYAGAGVASFEGGDVSAALSMTPISRWCNYYVEGLRWLQENIEIDGLYFDEVSYDRETLKRVRKVMARRPGSLIDLHANNGYSIQPANQYMEFFPYVHRLWFGEEFNYDESPDYWLIEISGIPYGLMGDMLQNGGNKWRGMIYGMTARVPWFGKDAMAMWPVWDAFGIAEAKMLGYWDPACPVRTDSPDVLATAYVRPGKTLLAVASWAKAPVPCHLKIDWKAFGLDPAKATLAAPEINNFQPARRFAPATPSP